MKQLDDGCKFIAGVRPRASLEALAIEEGRNSMKRERTGIRNGWHNHYSNRVVLPVSEPVRIEPQNIARGLLPPPQLLLQAVFQLMRLVSTTTTFCGEFVRIGVWLWTIERIRTLASRMKFSLPFGYIGCCCRRHPWTPAGWLRLARSYG